MLEVIDVIKEIPTNAYLLIVIILQFWQNKNRDAMFKKAMDSMTNSISNLTTVIEVLRNVK